MFSNNTVQWIKTLKHHQQVYLYCWLVSFGMGIKKEWSEKRKGSYINSKRHDAHDSEKDESDGHAEEVNIMGKCKHMDRDIQKELRNDIMIIYTSGIKEPQEIYNKLKNDGNLPNIDGTHITTCTVFRYVRKVHESFGIKKGKPVHTEIDALFRKGVTDIKEICKQLDRPYNTVYHALVRHGHIKPVRSKFKGRY